jgi:uncharacterized membrane protein
MWTRMELKTRAKEQMKGRYFNYLGVSLVPVITSYVINIPIMIIYYVLMFVNVFSTSFFDILGNMDGSYSATYDVMNPTDLQGVLDMYKAISIPIAFVTIAGILTSVFVIMPVTVGMTRWFIRSREEKNLSFSLCFSIFKRGSYLKTVGSVLYYMFFLMLWFMLFYIPGIVKTYSYRMIPFILADNPRIGAKRALKLSCMMTKGHKLDIFILDLSFMGWYLLGLLACCVGVYGVVPYHQATNAELYDSLKKSAVEKGYCTMEELGYVLVV